MAIPAVFVICLLTAEAFGLCRQNVLFPFGVAPQEAQGLGG